MRTNTIVILISIMAYSVTGMCEQIHIQKTTEDNFWDNRYIYVNMGTQISSTNYPFATFGIRTDINNTGVGFDGGYIHDDDSQYLLFDISYNKTWKYIGLTNIFGAIRDKKEREIYPYIINTIRFGSFDRLYGSCSFIYYIPFIYGIKYQIKNVPLVIGYSNIYSDFGLFKNYLLELEYSNEKYILKMRFVDGEDVEISGFNLGMGKSVVIGLGVYLKNKS